jgi:hypothetical protein
MTINRESARPTSATSSAMADQAPVTADGCHRELVVASLDRR